MDNIPDKLIGAYLEGSLDEAQADELSQWVRASKDHALYLASLTTLEHGLVKLARMQSNSDILAELQQAEQAAEIVAFPRDEARAPIDTKHAESLTRHQVASALAYVVQHTFTPKRVAMLASAAAVLLGVVLLIVLLTSPDTTEPIADNTPQNKPAESVTPILRDRSTTPVATLTAQHNAQWGRPASAGTEHPLTTGSKLHPNQHLTLTAGFAEITTTRGAIAIIEAPATIELINNNALHLHTGKLVGICETESSKGFVVKTDYADITDLGTEFGVRVNQEGVETSVFVGEVSIQATDVQAQHVMALQTARLEINADQHELTIENRLAEGYTRRLPRPALVEAVQFGVDGLDANVAPQSLFANALFYAERHYEPAIHTEAELPAELLGADIVQMPIHDFVQASEKFGDAVQVRLTVSQPAHVYVLVPPNARPGPWLQRDYVLTDLSLSYQTNNASGLDYVRRAFQIWQRRQPITGTSTVAGSLNHGGIGMYTMLVQPVDQHAHKSNPNPIH